jgi:flagellar biosynthesis/type III secretory pathway protein FliH
MVSQSEMECERYRARLKAQWDANSLLRVVREAREEALKEGLKKGHEEGRQQGRLIGQIFVCQRMLKQPPTSIEELQALSLEALKKFAEQLE